MKSHHAMGDSLYRELQSHGITATEIMAGAKSRYFFLVPLQANKSQQAIETSLV